MNKHPHDLLVELETAFKDTGLPFKIKPLEKIQLNFIDHYPQASSFGSDNFYWIMELSIQCKEEDLKLLGNLFDVDHVDERPMIDFDTYQRVHNMFDSEEDAFNFHRTMDFEKERTYHIKAKIELTEGFVSKFIEIFKTQTEPIRQRHFEKQFDKQVEEHLSDEYNKDDGHQ